MEKFGFHYNATVCNRVRTIELEIKVDDGIEKQQRKSFKMNFHTSDRYFKTFPFFILNLISNAKAYISILKNKKTSA